MADAVAGNMAIEEAPGAQLIKDRAAGENFSVASIALGRETRRHLLAIYGYARLVDELGDAVGGDRRGRLDAFEADLERVFDGGTPRHDVLRELQPTVRKLELPRGPFQRLIEANRQDQEHPAYATYGELLAYCDLSANPVGELVLHVFGAATPENVALSDKVCTALQLAEHWQDVAEDHRAGRIYLPAEDLERFGVSSEELTGVAASPRLKQLMAFEVARARSLLDDGAPLVGRLHGRARLAVAGYVGGGRAALDSIQTAGFDVLAGTPKATRPRRAAASLSSYLRPEVTVPDDEQLGIELAYETCRRVARDSGSSFYAGMRLLPADRRGPLFAIYALARQIDDIADGALSQERKLAELAAVRTSLGRLDESDDPVLVALADTARRFPVPVDAFGDLVDGAEMDVRGTTYATFAELEIYCRRVAGSIGRLSLGVFDCSDRERGTVLADELGLALQIGNVLRDVSEDAAAGRVYLPTEDLERFGVQAAQGAFRGPLELLIAFEAERGLGRLDQGLELVPLLDRRSAACVLAMAGKYRRLLERIAADPAVVLRGRVSLRPWEKGLVLARGVAGART
jgi:15-cis-phytoene synthase